jgi:hypothetical protein
MIKRVHLGREQNVEPGIWRVGWQGITAADTDCEQLIAPSFADRSIEVTGTFDGATVEIRGGITVPDFVLKDPQGNPMSFTAAGFKAIAECSWYLKPVILNAGPATNLNIALVAKRIAQ